MYQPLGRRPEGRPTMSCMRCPRHDFAGMILRTNREAHSKPKTAKCPVGMREQYEIRRLQMKINDSLFVSLFFFLV